MLKNLVIILMASVLVNNYVLSRFLGVCPFLGVSKKLDQAAGMGAAVIFVMLVATAATWPIYTYLLSPKYEYLQTIVFILVIASLVQMLEVILKKFSLVLYGAGVTSHMYSSISSHNNSLFFASNRYSLIPFSSIVILYRTKSFINLS